MATPASSEALLRAILVQFGQEWLALTKRIVGSDTLAEAMTHEVNLDRSEVALFVPHYWAVPFHEGHGPVSGKKMIFFPNKADDPRTRGGYPVRASEIKHLTPDEFKALKGKYVVIFSRKRVNKGSKFFVHGARRMRFRFNEIVQIRMDEYMRINFPPVTESATVLVI